MSTELTGIERSVRRAHRRLFGNSLLSKLGVGLATGMALGLVWFLAEPWLLQTSPDHLRWTVLGSLAAVGAVVAIVLAVVKSPTLATAALELDGRFELRERVTTVLGLTAGDRATSAGQAVLSDAAAKVLPLNVSEKFPLRPRRSSLLVPAFAGLIALTFFFYDPDTTGSLQANEGDSGKKKADGKLTAKDKKAPVKPFTQMQKPPEQKERASKSQDLKDLETELDKLMEKWAKDPAETDEKKREKVSELTAMEEKLKKFEQEKAQKLEALENKLGKLDRLNHDKEFADGPAEKFNDALSKGDLKKAEEELDQLKKKAKEKKLDKTDLQKLDRQMKQMQEEAEKLSRNKEEQKKLKDKLDKAKKDGRDKDAETLQRELDKMQKEGEASAEQMDKLAEQCAKCQKAIQNGDMEELANQLEAMKSQLKDIEGDLEDIDDAEGYLQRLKEEMKKAWRGCKGDGEDGDKISESDGAEWTNKGRPGAGRRDENKDAKSATVDERLRGLFDPKGKKSYGGSTRGPAFTKKSSVELGQDIQTAVQEASRGLDAQNVPRDAKAAVKEYMEKIGGTGK